MLSRLQEITTIELQKSKPSTNGKKVLWARPIRECGLQLVPLLLPRGPLEIWNLDSFTENLHLVRQCCGLTPVSDLCWHACWGMEKRVFASEIFLVLLRGTKFRHLRWRSGEKIRGKVDDRADLDLIPSIHIIVHWALSGVILSTAFVTPSNQKSSKNSI